MSDRSTADSSFRVIDGDDFIRNLWEVHLKVRAEGYVQVCIFFLSRHHLSFLIQKQAALAGAVQVRLHGSPGHHCLASSAAAQAGRVQHHRFVLRWPVRTYLGSTQVSQFSNKELNDVGLNVFIGSLPLPNTHCWKGPSLQTVWPYPKTTRYRVSQRASNPLTTHMAKASSVIRLASYS